MRVARCVALCALLASACGRLGFDPLGAGGDSDSGVNPNDPDGSAAAGDGQLATPSGCGVPDGDTSAQFSFESLGVSVDDDTGSHTVDFVGGSGIPVPGPSGCGMAVKFDGVYGEIADSPAWDLDEGSIDFWVNPADNGVNYYGLVSRDAGGQSESNHITIYRDDDSTIVVRMQNPGGSEFLCSDTFAEFDRWTHVGINFGPPRAELWVGGVLGTTTATVVYDPPGGSAQPGPCNEATTIGSISGNSEPWVLGAGNILSGTGSATPVMDPMAGALDGFRVSSIRRDFSSP